MGDIRDKVSDVIDKLTISDSCKSRSKLLVSIALGLQDSKTISNKDLLLIIFSAVDVVVNL